MTLARHRALRFLGLTGTLLLILLAATASLPLGRRLPLAWLPFLALPPSLLLGLSLFLHEEEKSGEALAQDLLGLGPLRQAAPLGFCAALLWIAAACLPLILDRDPLGDTLASKLHGFARMDLGPRHQALLGPGSLLVLPRHPGEKAEGTSSPVSALALRWDSPPRWVPLDGLVRDAKGLLLPTGIPAREKARGEGAHGVLLPLYPDRRTAALRRAFLERAPILALLGGLPHASEDLLALWTLVLCLSFPFLLCACAFRLRWAEAGFGPRGEAWGPSLFPWLLLLAGLLPTLLGIQLILLADGGLLPWSLALPISFGMGPFGVVLLLAWNRSPRRGGLVPPRHGPRNSGSEKGPGGDPVPRSRP